MKEKMRREYLDGNITHREYYASIVRDAGIVFHSEHEIVKNFVNSKDEHYNSIPLIVWDSYVFASADALKKAFKAHGDSYSIAGGVCAIKEAVRQAVESV